MPLNPDDIKALAEQTLVGQMAERMDRLTEERVEVLRNQAEATNRLLDIDNELTMLEGRLKGAAASIRAVLNKIDPPGQP